MRKSFKEIATEQIEAYEKKNADYGDAAESLYREHGMTYFVIMLEQKLARIKSLCKQQSVNFESLEDSFRDMSNYAIMAAMRLSEKKDDASAAVASSVIPRRRR